jgi:hypothetical protein
VNAADQVLVSLIPVFTEGRKADIVVQVETFCYERAFRNSELKDVSYKTYFNSSLTARYCRSLFFAHNLRFQVKEM